MSILPRLLLLAALLTIGMAFLLNNLRQKQRTGRTTMRWPDPRHPGVVLTDLLFWLSVAGWVAVSGAWVVWPQSRDFLGPLIASPAGPVQILGAVILLCGVSAILWGFISLGGSFRTSIDYGEHTSLVTRGIYRFSRNPMAAGLMLVGWGTALLHQAMSSLAVAAGLTLANRLRVAHEEKQLRRILGGDYLKYAQRVPRFLGFAGRKNP
ncbi:MAG: isoprenylcysteine carboxylmethyltransferase family protein [Candidatus Latescibacteria bacterium]|nr:isoprenylcysteine carboxylmethyltransferase family protein [Candidatus Latescibacterota bacterium]